MDKEEITEKAQELTIKNVTDGKNKYFSWGFYKGCIVGLEYNNKQITELEEKISVLLSCKNCPENKGGLICAKEYENKCLAQKIEFIKELQEENEELKVKTGLSIDCEKAQKNGELCLGYGGDEDEPCERCKNCIKCECGYYQLGETEKDEQLTKAKELLKQWLQANICDSVVLVSDTEQFLSEVEK